MKAIKISSGIYEYKGYRMAERCSMQVLAGRNKG